MMNGSTVPLVILFNYLIILLALDGFSKAICYISPRHSFFKMWERVLERDLRVSIGLIYPILSLLLYFLYALCCTSHLSLQTSVNGILNETWIGFSLHALIHGSMYALYIQRSRPFLVFPLIQRPHWFVFKRRFLDSLGPAFSWSTSLNLGFWPIWIFLGPLWRFGIRLVASSIGWGPLKIQRTRILNLPLYRTTFMASFISYILWELSHCILEIVLTQVCRKIASLNLY